MDNTNPNPDLLEPLSPEAIEALEKTIHTEEQAVANIYGYLTAMGVKQSTAVKIADDAINGRFPSMQPKY